MSITTARFANNVMRTAICLLLLAISIPMMAQTTQKGVVKEYNEKAQKTPLAGVELNVRSAGSAVSDKNGDFSLSFLTLKPGEKVNVRRIEKLGYEVFNKEAIEQWNLNPTNPFIIVMCKSEKFKKIRDNYEKVSSESYARQLKKEEAALAKLKADGKIKEEEYQKQLYELRESYEQQLDNLDNYIDRFSRIDLSELSAVEQEIIELVQQGKIDEAIARYEEQNYVDKYIQEVKRVSQLSSAINQLEEIKSDSEQNCEQLILSVKLHIETLQLAGGDENLKKIAMIYDNILAEDNSNLDIALNYITFLNTYHKYEKALEVYDIVKSQLDGNLNYKDRILTSVGNSLNQLQKLNEALEFYQEAISITESPDFSGEEYKRSRKEVLLSNMGLLYTRKRDYNNALNVFTECMSLYNTYGDNDLSRIRCISNFSSLCRLLKNYEKADSLLSEGLGSLANMDYVDNIQKEELVYSQAILTQGRGNVASDREEFDSARTFYDETISILQSLYDKNPRKYVASLAIANYNYGRTYFLKDEDSEEAIPYLDKSIGLYESVLHESYIQQLANNYAEAISLLGRIYTNRKDTTECDALCERIHRILESCKDFPYKGANLLTSIGSIYADLRIGNKAIEYFDKAVAATETMYNHYPTIYKVDLARLYSNAATTCCRMKNLERGKYYFSNSLPLWSDLYQQNQVEKRDYMDALNRGFLFMATTSEYMAGLEHLNKMQELEPSNVKLFEYECIILHGNGRIEEAKTAFSKLLKHFPDYSTSSDLYKNLGSQN